MKILKITQVKSVIDRSERQKKTMHALGLNKLNATVEKKDFPQIRGMVEKVRHLVTVEELVGNETNENETIAVDLLLNDDTKATEDVVVPVEVATESISEVVE